MSQVVVDASIALAWSFPDETSDYADAVLVASKGGPCSCPPSEPRNRQCRSRRRTPAAPEAARDQTIYDAVGEPLAPAGHTHGFSAYAAAYLELSIRHSAPLATLDDKLQKAAKLASVKIFGGKK